MEWTGEQRQVIETRNKDILVSAAAGSGKTAVLVERIIERILDKENPASIDRMLVVTFTEAAASEMRERILKAITKAAMEDSDNDYLQKQLAYIHSARICTIDSFCNEIIKDHFSYTDIDPSYRVATEDELALIRENIMEQVFEDYFAEGNKDFLDFIECRGGKKYQQTLSSIIEKVYKYSKSNPFPEKWLEKCLKDYEFDEPVENKNWYKYILKDLEKTLEFCVRQYVSALEICDEPYGPVKYRELFQAEMYYIGEAINETDLFKKLAIIKNMPFNRLPSITKKDDVDEKLKKSAQNCRKSVSAIADKIKKDYVVDSYEVLKQEIRENRRAIGVVADMTKSFGEKFSAYKKDHNLIDFNDMEHMALNILTKLDWEGNVVSSDIAKEISENYDEIMIDEYQDSNYLQEYILNAVSGKNRGINNMFMVGDVKQSIYKFRMARPELFLGKYTDYAGSSKENVRICLDKNFRSRKEVVNSVNFIFNQIMGQELGGIEYDDDHTLKYGSSYEEINSVDHEAEEYYDESLADQKTEVIIVDSQSEEDENLAGDEKLKAEGAAIAMRINELLRDNFQVTEKSGYTRKLRYSDIAVLTRSSRNSGEIIGDALMEEGIPVYVEKSTGYFDTIEVSTVINMLRVIDNPHQDIPLTAALKNMFHFTSKELALCAVCRNGDFFETIKEFAVKDLASAEDFDETMKNMGVILQKKIKSFLKILEDMRFKARYEAIKDIIQELLAVTGYRYFISSMPGGDVRLENICMLVKKAEDYESTSFSGLFNFIRYMDNIKQYEIEQGEATLLSENDNSVRVMTIHKSKGLEFPVVFLACTGKRINDGDAKETLIINENVGVGIDYINSEKRIRKKSFIKSIVGKAIKIDNYGEELRVLYVALTRAREKLIITGVDNVKTLLKKISDYSSYPGEKFGSEALMQQNSYLRLIMLAAVRNKDLYRSHTIKSFDELHDIPSYSKIFDCESDIKYRVITAAELVENRVAENIMSDMTELVFDKDVVKELRMKKGKCEDAPCKFFDSKYKYDADTRLNSKYSVSEIKKMSYENSIDEDNQAQVSLYDNIHKTESYVPEFIRKREKLEGAGRGTAYHRVFELVDYKGDISSPEAIERQIENMFEKGYIDEMMKNAVEPSKIYDFICSPIGRRMKEAADNNNLFREQQYVMAVSAAEIDNSYTGDETVLVQGAIDAYFIEKDYVVIVDYKTDNVQNIEQLELLYGSQLRYYAKAVETITGYSVKEKIIYSVKFGKCLEV